MLPTPLRCLCLMLPLLGLAGCQSKPETTIGHFSLEPPKLERSAEILVHLTCELDLQRADGEWLYWELFVPYGPKHRMSLFVSEENATPLLLKQTGGPVEISFWYHEETRSHWDSAFPHGELVAVRNQDGVVLDLSVCEIHGDTMTRQAVPILYGLPLRNFAEALARSPHAPLILGGCVTMTGDPTEEPAYVCPSCEKAFAAWDAQAGAE